MASMNSELIQLEDRTPKVETRRPSTKSIVPSTVSSDIDTSLRDQIVKAIRTVYDPEIPVNVYDLGLIYGIDIEDEDHQESNEERSVRIQMTLTAPGCPVADILVAEVEARAREVNGVSKAIVELVWDPPWSDDLMSEAAKLELNL
jgi:FeS assembly SUF system protein